MPTFASAPLVPGIGQFTGATRAGPGIRPVGAPVTARPAPLAQSTGEALTLDALMARQRAAAERQGSTMQQPVTNIAQGLGQLGWTLVNALQERRAEKGIAEGNADVAKAFGQLNTTTGELPPEAMSLLMSRDPDLGIEMYKTAMALKATQSKQENWDPIPTPAGENGQWYRNATTGETKKVGGGEGGAGWKPSDVAGLRQDVISDPSYKNLAQAAPIWSSMQDAYGRDTPQADLNMVIALAKLFDPTSVVRTQEGDQVVQTGGLPSQIFSQWKFLTGEPGARLAPDVRHGMMQEGWSRVKGYTDAYGITAKTYGDIATRNKVNPLDVVPDFGIQPWEDVPTEDPAPTPDDQTVPDDGQPASPAPTDTNDFVANTKYVMPNGEVGIYLGGDPNSIRSWKKVRKVAAPAGGQ
jgi:hypothetical protein